MKKFLALSSMFVMLVVAMSTTSCSTEKSITKAFAKNGYEMGMLTPQQQQSVAPLLSSFPVYNQQAIGYLVAGNTITFVYNSDETVWNNYCYALTNAGFSKISTGYVRADKASGYTFNVASNTTEVYGQPFRMVTFTANPF